MSELVFLGGKHVDGFALGDASPVLNPSAIVRGAVTGAVIGVVVGSLVDYSRTKRIGWEMPATFATVGAIGGGILGAI